MDINTHFEIIFNNFVNYVVDRKIVDASLYWDRLTLPIFYANFENFYFLFQAWKIRKIFETVKINKYNYLINMKLSQKNDCLNQNQRGGEAAMPFCIKNKGSKEISLFYSMKVGKTKTSINWSYAVLKSLIKKNRMFDFRTEHIELFSDHIINDEEIAIINELEFFIIEYSLRYNWFIKNKIVINWMSNIRYPFIYKSAFVEPTYGEIYIFRNKLNIECLKHEFIHRIFWNTYKVWPKALLREGIASAFGENKVYEDILKAADKKIKFIDLFSDNKFWEGGTLSLILSGLFVKFLLSQKDMIFYEMLYSCQPKDILSEVSNIYDIQYMAVKSDFIKWINKTYGEFDVLE